MLGLALNHINRGFAVFPLNGKIPLADTHGCLDATADEQTVRQMWAKHPKANIGIATNSQVFVVDVDVKNGKVGDESLYELQKKYGQLPETVECKTTTGGRHLYFRNLSGVVIRNSQSKIGKDLDVRGEGGYVVAPGSVLDGRTYEWEASCHPDDVPIAEAPQWFIDLIAESASKEKFALPEGQVPQGTQDDTLFRLACSLKAQGFTADMVRGSLKEALKKCPQDPKDPFDDEDIERWIKGAFGYPDSKKRERKKINELELALRLKEKHLLLHSDAGKYYRYLNGYYQEITEDTLVKLIIRDYGCLKNNIINLIIRLLNAEAEIKTDHLNRDNFLNLANGLFDLDKYVLKDHTPAVNSTIRLNITYDPNATCPLWEEAIKTIVDNEEHIKVIQEFFGLCMTKDTYGKALFFVGEGNNGKSTLLDVLKAILGNDNTCEVQLEQLEKSYYVAQLHNKLLNISSEIGASGTVCDEMFKKIVTHDPIMGDHKFGHPFSFRPVCKLIFATNNMPRTDDKSSALYRRLLIVPFTKTFTDLDDKHHYAHSLLNESNGIFNWMVVGLKRLKERGRFAIGKNMIEIIENYRTENNPVLSFIEDQCALESTASVTKNDIYTAYRKYCEESGFRSLNIRKFGKELKRFLEGNILPGHNNTGKSRLWNGIRLMREHEHRPF